MDDKHVELVCDNCHKAYTIHIRSMYRRKQFNRPNLCQECSRKAVADKNRETFKKPEIKKKISEKTKQGLQNMPQSSYDDMCKNRSIRKTEEWNNLTQTEYDERCDLIKNGMKLPYMDHVEQERKIILRRNKESFIKLPNIILHNLDMINNKPEIDFINLLRSFEYPCIIFNYQWYNIYEHPKFHELFPYNPITGSKYVSPFHRWDFKILTNKCDIFVDIDGSIHNKNNCDYIVTNDYGVKFNLRDSTQFNDSQRIYQTDNSPAYIVQCYDNELNFDCKVANVYNNNNIITLENFIKMLLEYNKLPIMNNN